MNTQKFRWLVGTFNVLLPDLASGVIIAAVIQVLFGVPFSVWPFIVGAVSAVFIFDLDLVISYLRSNQIKFDHRLLLHKPILLIPIWLFFAWAVSPMYATLIAGCGLAHAIDDVIGDSQEWGIRVFWPLSKRTFVFFSRRGGPWKLVRSWDPDQYQMPTHEDELEKYYLHLGPKMLFTLGWTTVAIVIGIASLARMLSLI